VRTHRTPWNAAGIRLLVAAAAALSFGAPGECALSDPCESGGGAPHVRRITLQGNGRTRERVFAREMRLRAGATYCSEAARQDERRLLDLGLFSDVQVRADSASTDSADVIVEVRERATLLPIPELSYSAENGTTYGLTIRESNFLGDGQRLGVSALFGARESLSALWTLPWIGHVHAGLFVSAYDSRWRDRVENLRERRRGVRLGANRYFSGYRYQVGLDTRVEDVESDPLSDADTLDVPRHDLVRSLAVSAGYDARDFRTNPRRGFTVGARYEQVGSWLGGSVTLNRTSFGSSVFVPLSGSFTLALGAQATLARGTVPDYERTRLGGIATVRGFPEGRATGESRVWQSVELRFPLMKKRTFRLPVLKNFDVEAAGAVFGDIGAIWDGGDTRAARTLYGVGTGVRVFMPFTGVSRTDIAVGSEGEWVLRGDNGMKF
jgi:outer membrane protein insertion porin family